MTSLWWSEVSKYGYQLEVVQYEGISNWLEIRGLELASQNTDDTSQLFESAFVGFQFLAQNSPRKLHLTV